MGSTRRRLTPEFRVLSPPSRPSSLTDVWPTKKGARLAVGQWIEDRYYRRRRHASLGQVSPVNFEMQYLTNTAALKKAV